MTKIGKWDDNYYYRIFIIIKLVIHPWIKLSDEQNSALEVIKWESYTESKRRLTQAFQDNDLEKVRTYTLI